MTGELNKTELRVNPAFRSHTLEGLSVVPVTEIRMTDEPQMTLLEPPYDMHAVWHQHAFLPDGTAYPNTDEDEMNFDCRFDAVEDRLGRIFIWHVGTQKPVALCIDRNTAVICAIALAREYTCG